MEKYQCICPGSLDRPEFCVQLPNTKGEALSFNEVTNFRSQITGVYGFGPSIFGNSSLVSDCYDRESGFRCPWLMGNTPTGSFPNPIFEYPKK